MPTILAVTEQRDGALRKVSLEVVQLSIECVDRTAACYEAVGKSLAANELLFAEIDEGPRKQSVKVTVTLFDVDAKQRKKAAIKVFASEEDVVWGVADVGFRRAPGGPPAPAAS